MKRIISLLALLCLLAGACSLRHETSETVARSFVQCYFYSDDRSDVLNHSVDTALEKLTVENEYFENLRAEKSEIIRPAMVSMIDSTPVHLNIVQYTFSVRYQGSLTRFENMTVTLRRDDEVWKVSDYRFSHTGE